MRDLTSYALLGVAAFGLLLLAVQLFSLRRHLKQPPRTPRGTPPISILKPLCGIDDALDENLARFAALDYPAYELLLGVRSLRDPAYPIARRAEEKWPGRVRVVVQRGQAGWNPKVNQLVELSRAARHEILIVSDSNVTVGRDYLMEVAAHFEDERVGLVSHPIAGAGAARLGSLLDNLHLSSHVGPGVVAAARVAKKDIVVGKSMAIRRRDLEALGGFAAVKDVLAEDYVLGKAVRTLGKRVAIAARPVINVSRDGSVGDFVRRYRRWAVMHRKAVGTPIYLGELVLNPTLLALAALAAAPGIATLSALGAIAACKSTIDLAAARSLQQSTRPVCALVVPLKDLLVGAAWLHGLIHSQVEWRGNRLRVHRGTRLALAA